MTQDALQRGQELIIQINSLSNERDHVVSQHKSLIRSLDTATAAAIQTSITDAYNAIIGPAQTELANLSSDYKKPTS